MIDHKTPFATYNGGKAGNGTYQNIINHIPPIHCYIEAMVGGGGVFRNLRTPDTTVINDIDSCVADKYRQLSLPGVTVRNEDYGSLIDEFGYKDHGTLLYFDPPYLLSTRRSKKPLYKFEWDIIDHSVFLSRIKKCTSAVLVSHYPCTLYDSELANWNTHTFESMTRQGMRTERIYYNYPKPKLLQDYRYTGKNFTDRQRIKRRAIRLREKLKGLDPLERAAVLSCVLADQVY